ncbi:DUF2169 family type VI secretion system accessory protein [Nannocystis pusilla]|uniref:DUF2169 domain-containing protein n=1 Tax=Nannocystis pusilla TaxID=889268 RepID=A0ABS7TU78_9BACT|nr:DUF2169 domain-containing protein [Nannocystis pusilla]MBZ5711707.1 DUF2169 domain-containing protein [Nannocystis pusilla]
MQFFNYTPYPAYLFRGCIEARKVLACAMLRVTYDIVDGRLKPADDQPWGVSPAPWQGPYGPMPSDQRYVRGGVDLLVFGSARSARPVPSIEVVAQVGARWRARILAWGDRHWRPGLTGLAPGAPEPTREVPLTLARAYGGKDRWDGVDVAYVDNPDGRGFYLEADRARGNLLPNLEDPDAPIRAWSDRPEPVGTGPCPQTFAPRVRRGVELDETGQQIRRLKPEFFNDAFPKMIVPRAEPGERVSITGVCEDGALAFELPVHDIRVRVEVGDDIGERTPAIDQIGVEADARRVFLTYRYSFAYHLTPHQRRTCMLGLVEPG